MVKKTPNARIVNVSSMAAKWVPNFDVRNLNQYPDELRKPDLAIYCRSKLCNILFTIELADRLRGTGVTTYSLHPGAVFTDIFRKMPTIMKFVVGQVINWFFKVK